MCRIQGVCEITAISGHYPILVDIGYAELKKATDTSKSQSNIYEPDWDPIRVIENPPQFPGRSNSSPTAKDSI